MRFARWLVGTETFWVQIEGQLGEAISAAPWEPHTRTGRRIDPSAARTLPPVTPSKIVCVGRNYADHAKERGAEIPIEPLLFFKPPSSLLSHGGTVILPPESERVDHEAELAIVIGRRVRRADEAEAHAAVFGYLPALDITARDLQKKDGQWTRAKGFDTFCPVGPSIETSIVEDARVECHVGGNVRQSGTIVDMIFPIAKIVSYISQSMTLEPGDLVLTGTPAGVGPLQASDLVRVSITGLADLSVTVAAEPSAHRSHEPA